MSNQSIFLIAHYYIRPKSARTQTQIKGWMKDADNVSYDEQVAVAKRLKTNDYSTAKIILDLKGKKIVKNGWQTDATFDQLFGYFLNNYPQYIAGPMSMLDPEYLTKFNSVNTADSAQTDQPAVEASATISSSISSAD